MANRVRGRTFQRGSRRQTDWGISFSTTSHLAVPANGATLVASTPAAGFVGIAPITLIRTRGEFAYVTDQTAASEEQSGAVGICLVSEQAGLVGITAIPHPSTDATWDGWLYHRWFHSQFLVTSAIGTQAEAMHSFEIDSKAMRKIGSEELLALVVENDDPADAFNVAFGVRFLLKAG